MQRRLISSNLMKIRSVVLLIITMNGGLADVLGGGDSPGYLQSTSISLREQLRTKQSPPNKDSVKGGSVERLFEAPLSVLDLRDAQDELELIVPEYPPWDYSFVRKRFDHSSFVTELIESGSHQVFGEDQFRFFWKLNEKENFLINWHFSTRYPNWPGMYCPKDVDQTAVVFTLTW